MGVRFLFLLALLGPAARTRASLPGWTFTNLSDLLPDQPTFPATRSDSAPSAARERVAWRAHNPMPDGRRGIALWDRRGVSYLVPDPPYTPQWGWTGLGQPSAWGSDLAFAFSAIWPPDAGPGDPHYAWTETFFLDGLGLHRITWDQASRHWLPCLHEGKIAWQSRSAWDSTDDWEIYFWDGVATLPITHNDADDAYPSLYGRTIAWYRGAVSPEATGTVLYLPVPPAGQQGPLPPPVVVGPGAAPSLFKNKIAYHASDGNDTEIFLFDIESAQTAQVTDNEYDDMNPSLFDGTIAWQAYTAGLPADIFYWDGKTTHRLTNDTRHDDINPSLWGTGLNATIAYMQVSGGIPGGSWVLCARRGVLSVVRGPLPGDITVTWPSVEGRTYRVEYTDDLITWQVAADGVPSAGDETTCWSDTPQPSVRQRFYHICDNE